MWDFRKLRTQIPNSSVNFCAMYLDMEIQKVESQTAGLQGALEFDPQYLTL